MASNKLITSNFKLNNIKQFVESITEPANTVYYVFAGKPTPYSAGDTNIDTPVETVESLLTTVYDEMVYAKKVTSNDVLPVVKRYDWETGIVYDMYDSADAELASKKFFVVSSDAGNYHVFKCLFNNNGAASTAKPTYNPALATNDYYETADGYIWKYLYSLSGTTFTKFSTADYIPIRNNANVTAQAVTGSIDVIKVESQGRNYNNYLTGSFVSTDVRYNGSPYRYRITNSDASLINGFYDSCIIKITSGTSEQAGQYRKITSYTVDEGAKIIYIDSPFATDPTNCNYEIMPAVSVYGDDRYTTPVIARALVNTVAGNTIYKVDVLNRGKGYFVATANVYASPVVRESSVLNDAVVRPIISPRGGHGFDAESELYATAMCISVKFSNSESNTISTDNDFRTIGLLKDPQYDNVRLNFQTGTLNTPFVVTEKAAQVKLRRLSGSVSVQEGNTAIVGLGTLVAVQVNSVGTMTYSNNDIMYITNVAVPAICNVSTLITGELYSTTILSPGYGFADPVTPLVYVVNTGTGNTRYFNSKIVNGVTASANGTYYSNSDYIIITSPNSDSINAVANVQTNSTGGVNSITITSSGKNFLYNEVSYITVASGGTGYDSTTCNQIAFTGGGGTGAVATYTNSATGVITSVSLISRGINYTSNPTATALGNSAAYTPATFNIGIRTKDITIKIANSSDGYSNGGKVGSITVTSTGNSGLYSNNDLLIVPSYAAVAGNAVANVLTFADGSMNSVSLNATSGNYGFNLGITNNSAYTINSTSGNIRYFNTKLVRSISVSNSSPSHRVNSVIITANGQNYNSTSLLRVDIIDGGIGYNSTINNRIVFTNGGGGSGANAIFVNNDIGKIVSVTMVANGSGYTSAPTATPNSSSGGIGANLASVLANSFTFTSTTGGYGAVAYFTNNSLGNLVSVVVANDGFKYTSAPTATPLSSVGSGATFTVTLKGGANNFANSDIIRVVSPDAVDAVANAVTNSTGFLTSSTMTISGKDIKPTSYTIYTTNSTSGNTRYFDSTSVRDVAVNYGGYSGLGSNDDVFTITGGTIAATGTVETTITGQLSTISLTTSGKGFTNSALLNIKLSNTAGGNTRYLNSNIVSNFVLNDGGSGYSNSDYIKIVGDSSTLPAYANIITDSSGKILVATLTDRGKNFVPSFLYDIVINAGGTGYSNSDYITFCGGGGTGANAVLQTNSTGGITKAYLINSGANYDCLPTVEIANSIGGTSTGSSANIVVSVARPTTIRIYDEYDNLSNGRFADFTLTISNSAQVAANLIYSPIHTLSTADAANLNIVYTDSANLHFTTKDAANLSLILTGQLTSFDSSIGSGDYIYLQSAQGDTNLLQANQVVNATYMTVNGYPTFTSDAVAISIANVFAQGIVTSQSPTYIETTNTVGEFAAGQLVYGLDSDASAIISSVSLNGVTKSSFNAINQLFFYRITGPITGTFQEDELVYGAETSTARYHSSNSMGIFVTSPTGLFFPGNTISNETGSAFCTLSSGSTYKYEGDLKRGTGEVIYIENIEPISRSPSQSETIRLIVEF